MKYFQWIFIEIFPQGLQPEGRTEVWSLTQSCPCSSSHSWPAQQSTSSHPHLETIKVKHRTITEDTNGDAVDHPHNDADDSGDVDNHDDDDDNNDSQDRDAHDC